MVFTICINHILISTVICIVIMGEKRLPIFVYHFYPYEIYNMKQKGQKKPFCTKVK